MRQTSIGRSGILYKLLKSVGTHLSLRVEIVHESSSGCQAPETHLLAMARTGSSNPHGISRPGAQREFRSAERFGCARRRKRTGWHGTDPVAYGHQRRGFPEPGTALGTEHPLAPRRLRLLRRIGVESALHPVVTPKLNRMLRALGPIAATHGVCRTIMLTSPADSLGMPRVNRDIACHGRSLHHRPPPYHFGKYSPYVIRRGEARAGVEPRRPLC